MTEVPLRVHRQYNVMYTVLLNIQDEDLLMELQKSMREGEKKMQTIVEEFVIKQEQEYGSQRSPEGDSCSAAEHGEEGQEQDEEEEERDEEGIYMLWIGPLMWSKMRQLFCRIDKCCG